MYSGYRQGTLITAKTLAIAVIAAGVALYTALVLLRSGAPGWSGWAAILAGFTVIALAYGAFGLLLGVLVASDLEGFFLIIMGGLMDTFLQNPLGNPLANKPLLEWFPSFGPTAVRHRRLTRATPPCGRTWPSAWPGPPRSPPSGWPSSGYGPAAASAPADPRGGAACRHQDADPVPGVQGDIRVSGTEHGGRAAPRPGPCRAARARHRAACLPRRCARRW